MIINKYTQKTEVEGLCAYFEMKIIV